MLNATNQIPRHIQRDSGIPDSIYLVYGTNSARRPSTDMLCFRVGLASRAKAPMAIMVNTMLA